MIYDEFQALGIAADGDGLALCERSLTASVVRFLLGLFPLSVGLLTVFVFLGPGVPRPAGDGLSAVAAWGLIGIFLTTLGLVPIVLGIGLIGRRSAYYFLLPQCRLRAVTRLFGLVVWLRTYAFSKFQHVCIRRVRRGPFGGAWQFVVSCEGTSASLGIASCRNYERARMVAECLGEQMRMPVRSCEQESVA